MVTNIPYKSLKKWVRNYQENKDCTITNYAGIYLGDLEKFMETIKKTNKDVNGIKIYLTRFNRDEEHEVFSKLISSQKLIITDNGLSQISFVIVPTILIDSGDHRKGYKDMTQGSDENERIYILAPADSQSEHSGLCPPSCNE